MYDYVRLRLNKLVGQLRYLPRTAILVWTAAPKYTLIWAALLMVQGLLPVATVYLTRAVINSLIAAIRGGASGGLKHLLVLLVVTVVVMLVGAVIRSATTWLGASQAELTTDYINHLIHEKSTAVDLAFYELPEAHDHLHRARAEGSYRPVAVIENLGALLQGCITLLAMVAVLVPFGPILPLTLVLSTVPAMYVVLRSSQYRYHWNYGQTADERRSRYYDWILTSGDAAAELRLLALSQHFRSAYQALRGRLRTERMGLARKQCLSEFWAGSATFVISGLSMALMIWRAIRGLISIGDLALFYQAFNQGLGLARSLLINLGKLYENTLFLGNLYEFLSLKPQIVSPAVAVPLPPLAQGVQFENVNFRYPGADRFTLSDFSMRLKPGEVTAIVGPNGAGKSTILKLLCRFYEPEHGAICIDGVPLADFSLEELRSRISALFQNPVRFNSTAADNIRFGNLRRGDEEAVLKAAAFAGAEDIIRALPQGFRTHLGKQFSEGVELSAGEWQRIAIARVFFRQEPIILLDEPTSAMDPWTEITWLEQLRRFTAERIAVVITHRFTTAMLADVIHVMDQGRIIESGTHDELLVSGGLYAEGWASQRDRSRQTDQITIDRRKASSVKLAILPSR